MGAWASIGDAGEGEPTLCRKHFLAISVEYDERSSTMHVVSTEPRSDSVSLFVSESLCSASKLPSVLAELGIDWLLQKTAEPSTA